MHHFNLLLLV